MSKKNIKTTNSRIIKLRQEIKNLVMFRNISIAVILLILFIVLWYVMYITFHDVESVEIMLSYIGIAIAVIAIFVGSFISSSIKINDNFSEIYEIGVDAYNSNDLYKGNDVFFYNKNS